MSDPILRAAAAFQTPGQHKVFIVSHSYGEGGATGNNTYYRMLTQRWPTQMAFALQRHFFPPSANCGVGYVDIHAREFVSQPFPASAGGPVSFAVSGGGTFVPPNVMDLTGDSTAYGGVSYTQTTNETTTITALGTSLKIHFGQGSATYAPFTVSIDGGSPITVTPSTTGGARFDGFYQTSILGRGTHTFLITPTSGQVAVIRGVEHFDGDEANHIHNINGSRGAWMLSDFISSGVATSTGLANTLSSAGLCPNPDLVCIMCLVNDYQLGTRTAANAQSDLGTIITNIKTACSNTPSFLIAIEPQIGTPLQTPLDVWSAYVAAANAVAAADPTNVFTVDLGQTIAEPTNGNNHDNGEYLSDNVHPFDHYHTLMGQLLAQPMITASASVSKIPTLGSLTRPHQFQPGFAR